MLGRALLFCCRQEACHMTPYQSENITDLAKTLLNVQRTVQPATKDAENPFTKSWYASLNSVMDACRDALIENGIWLCQYPVPVEQPNSLGLVTKLTHAESGQWQSSLAVVPLPKADPQGMGSAMTYARRYALTAMRDCYKIKLRSIGYRLVYKVNDDILFVTVISIGKRERLEAYRQALRRMPSEE